MEKRLFLAVLLTLLFFAFWNKMTARYYLQQPVNQEVTTKTSRITPQRESEEPQAQQSILKINENNRSLPEARIGSFIITYSTTGGYIQEISVDRKDETLPFKNIGFLLQHENTKFNCEVQADRIIFKTLDGEQKEYVFDGNVLKIKFTGPLKSELLLSSNYLTSNGLDQRYQEIFYSQESQLRRIGLRKADKITQDNIEFAGARNRYYCLSLLKGSYTVKLEQEKYKLTEKNQTSEKIKVNLYLISPSAQISLYIGPQKKNNLKPYDLQEIINYGFFHAIALSIVKVLHLFHFLTRNWGLSVILFSLLVSILLYPLTSKSTQGMKQMREFQALHNAEIAKLRQKYKDNPSKIHQATVELYKKHGVNPLKGCSSGCLPMLFQIPIIWAFWAVAPRAWEFKGARFVWIKDLSLPDRLFHLPFELPFSLGPWLNILPLLTAGLMFVQMRISNPNIDPEQAQQQKMIALFMPVMMTAVLYNMPSAMLLYWLTNSLVTFYSQRKVMQNK